MLVKGCPYENEEDLALTPRFPQSCEAKIQAGANTASLDLCQTFASRHLPGLHSSPMALSNYNTTQLDSEESPASRPKACKIPVHEKTDSVMTK